MPPFNSDKGLQALPFALKHSSPLLMHPTLLESLQGSFEPFLNLVATTEFFLVEHYNSSYFFSMVSIRDPFCSSNQSTIPLAKTNNFLVKVMDCSSNLPTFVPKHA
jgi:hypothetical protein